MSVWVTREADTSTMRLFGSLFSENGGSGEQTGEELESGLVLLC